MEIKVPALGESITEATVAKWFKSVGDAVAADEALVELETDKVTVEVYAPAAGTLGEIVADEGSDVEVGGLLGTITEGPAASAAKPREAATAAKPVEKAAPAPEPAPQPAPEPVPEPAPEPVPEPAPDSGPLAPAVRKLIEENALDAASIAATGRDGRLTKGDVLAHLEAPAAAPAVPAPVAPAPAPGPVPAPPRRPPRGTGAHESAA